MLDGAGFGIIVVAISVEALGDEELDVFETIFEAFVADPQLQFTHSRRIDYQSAIWENDQFSFCRSMLPAIIAFANLLHFLPFAAEQMICDRRFPHARRTN